MFFSNSLRGMMLLDELHVGVDVDVEGRVEVGGGVDAVKRSICPALITRGESESLIFAGVVHNTVPVVLVGVEAVGVVVAVALALLLLIISLLFDPTNTTSSPPAQ